MRAETPSEVLFDFLKCDLQINNREAARILISDKPMGSKPAQGFALPKRRSYRDAWCTSFRAPTRSTPRCLPIFRRASRTWLPL